MTEEFELEGARFRLDVRPGHARGKSTSSVFTLVKTQAFLEVYRELVPRAPKSILEIGMFEGGSIVFLDKLFGPERIMGVDIRAEPIGPLEDYRRDHPHVRTLYATSQDDERLPEILGEAFPDGLDMIVDDASHIYELSRATFHLTFPLLNPGGLYILEDWPWSHTHPHQDEGHPWHKRPALTNLVLELVIALATASEIGRITVHPNLVVVEKRAERGTGLDLDRFRQTLRGRDAPRI